MTPDSQDKSRSAGPLAAAILASLTPAQRRVLVCLDAAWQEHLPVDSLDQLCAQLGLSSRGALHRHVGQLVAMQLVAPLDKRRGGVRPGQAWLQARAALPSGQQPAAPDVQGTRHLDPVRQGGVPEIGAALRLAGVPMRAVPRLGRIAAGAPLDAVFEDEPVWIPEHLAPRGEAFVLEVQGDSMSGDGILDGDLVVVEPGVLVRPGEIAVVLVAGEGATLKRFRHEGQQLRLIASNPAFADRLVSADTVAIQGRITGLMRQMQGARSI